MSREAFGQVMALSRSHADSLLPIAAELQHVFFTTTGDQPLSAGWLNVYGEGGLIGDGTASVTGR